MRECLECGGKISSLLFPVRSEDPEFLACDSGGCGAVFIENEIGGLESGESMLRLAMDRNRSSAATSGEHAVDVPSIMELVTQWRAAAEMDTLAFIGEIQQRLGVLDNRLHSIKKRLAESLLGEPTPLQTEEMLELVDECIDLASPSPARERGVRNRGGVSEVRVVSQKGTQAP